MHSRTLINAFIENLVYRIFLTIPLLKNENAIRVKYSQKMKCECETYVIEHIPVADLVKIIYDYMMVDPRLDRKWIEFVNDENDEYDYFIYHNKYPEQSISMGRHNRNTDIYRTEWACNVSINDSSQLYAKIFCPHTQQINLQWRRCVDTNPIKKLDWYVNIAYEILTAEETSGHLHPDPRIIISPRGQADI